MRRRLLHLSDTHAGHPGTFHDGSVPLATPEESLERILAVLADPVDVIVHTGDIAEADADGAAERVRDRLADVGVPVLAVPGNHDDPATTRAVFGTDPIELGGWRIIGADTVIPGEIHGTAERILDRLDAYDDRPTVLAIHHPIRSRSTHPWFQLVGGDRLLQALRERTHVRAVLSGHTHQRFEHAEPWGLNHLGGPSTYYGVTHDGNEFAHRMSDIGAQLIELDDETITATALGGGAGLV